MNKKIQGFLVLMFLLLSILFLTNFVVHEVPVPKLPSRAEKIIIDTSTFVSIVPEHMEKARVKKVVDGDTIELETGQKVRYIGIDTPETKHPTKGIQCFGKEASEMNRKLVEGKEIYLTKDVSETDRYKRLLRYVYLPDPTGTNEALFVNKYLVEEGYAYSLTYPPDVKYSVLFSELQKKAHEENKGLWAKCPAR